MLKSNLFEEIIVKLENIPIFNSLNFSISENLLKPLPTLKDSGKIYTKLDIDNLSDKYTTKRMQADNRSQKYKNLSLFDLVMPVLMPSIDLEIFSTLDFPNKLFDYQVQGVKFLISNRSALLADQMGTGKTVMTTTAMRILFIKGLLKKALIIAPSSLLSVWEEHIRRWAPEISFTTVYQEKRYREILWKIKSHVYIVSYDTLKYDYKDNLPILKDFLKDVDLVVVDEAHNIKNKDTLKSKAVKYISKKAKYRWALSGTPLQNHIKEILSVYEFLKPDYKPNQNITEEEVKSLIKPIMLRRLKKDVLNELPEKFPPEIERFELSALQRDYYEKFLNAEKKRLESFYDRHKFDKNLSFLMKQNIIYSLQKLRQICNFPPESMTSPKAERVVEIVREIVENDEKVIIFSNFVKEGVNKIVENLKNTFPQNMITTYDGSMNQTQRDVSVKKFMEDSSCKIFVGTLNTASEGLTLTSGSYVIFFDLHWNPAKMWQAEDRVHRIGQKNKVNIFYFVTNNTIEEKILTKLNQKRIMIENIVDSDINEIESISIQELLYFIDLKITV